MRFPDQSAGSPESGHARLPRDDGAGHRPGHPKLFSFGESGQGGIGCPADPGPHAGGGTRGAPRVDCPHPYGRARLGGAPPGHSFARDGRCGVCGDSGTDPRTVQRVTAGVGRCAGSRAAGSARHERDAPPPCGGPDSGAAAPPRAAAPGGGPATLAALEPQSRYPFKLIGSHP